MKPILQVLTFLAAAFAAANALAAESRIPAGNWQSAQWATYTNPAFAGSEFYLNIDVAKDGGFRGVWSPYHTCTSYVGAYGLTTISCNRNVNNRVSVSGRFGPDGRGAIDLQKLGRSAFRWTVSAANELAIELPKNWQGNPAVLYRSRLARDGKEKPAAASALARDEVSRLSTAVLYREFVNNPVDAQARYGDKAVVLEGRRGELILLDNGGAAVHVADGLNAKALILSFPVAKELSGINESARFRFKCYVRKFEYRSVWMDDCSIVPPGSAPARSDDDGLPSARVLYREFAKNSDAALARYRGKTLVLDGRRGELILRTDGGAAIHVADGFTSSALILDFPRAKQVDGIAKGTPFRFKCTVAKFEYEILWMENCSIVP